MSDWRLGTMGFSYREWAGVFYPRGMKPGDYLLHYSRQFNAVELDTTFHALPTVERVVRWAGITPEDFRFCAKTPRAITHDLPLADGVQNMLHFLEVMRAFGPKLGVILLQFPPSFTIQESAALDVFLGHLPGDIAFAVEFRHLSWHRPHTADLLRKHRVAWTSIDYAKEKASVIPTTDFLYLRWIGEHDRFPDKNYEAADLMPRLQWWKSQIDPHVNSGAAKRVWGFFNNDYAGYSIATCNRFKRMAGEPVVKVEAKQGLLFG